METGMLNSLHNEEEQFAIGGRSASHDSESPQWSGDTVGNGSQLSPQSEEGTGEDFDRTLSDWRRHVASLPMSDSEDYIVDEVNEGLNDTPSPCKAEKFSFSPDCLSPQVKVDNLSIKPENLVRSKNTIHMGKVRGDNRMMDNDNTSSTGNFYATINSVVYELDSDPNEKYIAYHGNSELEHDFISSTIQVISVDPDTLDISDTSSEGSMESSRCSSPYNNYSESEKSDCEDNGDDLVCERDEEQDEEEVVCVEDDDNEDDEIQFAGEDVICVSKVPQTPPRDISSRSSMLKEKCSPSSESSVDSPIAHVETPIERSTETSNSYHISPLPVLTNCNITPENTFSRRQKLKSISLPQSPSHCVDTPGQDYQTCMTFEDLKLIDFDRMFHISPSKVFNKHFDMPDPFDDHVPPFPETVSFDPIVDIKTKREPESILKSINNSQLDESKTTNDIIGIIDKNGMLDKVMNSSDLLFNHEDLKPENDLDNPENFDLTSFITGEGDGDPSHLLNENFISSPYMVKSELKGEGRRPYGQNIDKFEIDMPDMSNVIMSTPKRNKSKLTEVSSVMTLITQNVSWPRTPKAPLQNTIPVKTPTKLKSSFTNYPREPLVMRITKSEGSRTPKEDSEDYIDVETVSDGESFPVLAANNLDSLLEQFEATEKISKLVSTVNGSAENVVKMEPASKPYGADDWEAKTEQFSTAWSQPPKPPQQKKLGSSRSPERKHYGSLTEMANIVSPCLSKSTHSTSTESVQLDHDYCSPIRRTSGHLRTISSSTEGDSESLRSFSEDSFISPKPSSITAFYKQINSNRMLGLGKGKNIAMCMEHRTDEFKTNDSPDSVNSLLIKTPKKAMSTESLLKVIDASPSIARSDFSDSDCSMSDHSYSKMEALKTPDTHTFITPIKNNKSKSVVKSFVNGGKVANKKIVEVVESVCDVTCDKSVKKNVVVATLKSDIERLAEFNKNPPPSKIVSKNTKVNKNSLLISNFNNNSDMVFVKQNKGFLQNDQEKSLLRQKQSLLKPIVKEEIKKVSLLKNNYVEKEPVKEVVKEPVKEVVKEPVKEVVKEPVKEVVKEVVTAVVKEIAKETKVEVKVEVKSVVEVVNQVVLKSSENVPVKKVTLQKAVEICPIEVIIPAEPQENTIKIIKPVEKKQPLKRKLNLEEYKKRREGSSKSCETSRTSSPVSVLSDNWAFSSPNSPVPITNDLPPPKAETTNSPSLTEMLQNVLSNSKHPIAPEIAPEKIQEVTPVQTKKEVEKVVEKAVEKIVEIETKLFDPIAEASKKAIQLKKLAAQRCNEDKIVQSKIPKLENVVILPMVTENGKVLPMIKSVEEMAAETLVAAPARRKNSEYEEIVMVSVGVNTNPVIFLEPEIEVVSDIIVPDDVVPSDDGAKNGIQFTIKKKSNIVQKNVFDSVLVVPELPVVPIVEEVCSAEVIIVNPKSSHSTSKSSSNGRSKSRREPKSDVKENEEINQQNTKAMAVTLNNLNATLQKVEMRKDLKISRNSLLASIQKVVRKKNSANKSPDTSKDSSKHNGHSSSKHHSDKTSHSSEHNHRTEKTKYSDHVERTKLDVDKSKSEHNDRSSLSDRIDKSKHSSKHSEQGEMANNVVKIKVNSKLVEKIKHSEVIEKTNELLKPTEKPKVPELIEKIKISDPKQKLKQSDQHNASFKLIVCDVSKTSPKKSPLPDSGKSSPYQIPLPEETVKEESSTLDHGEDKVIMHLKKNRTRPETCSLSVQTDSIIIQDIVDEVAIVPVIPQVETPPMEEIIVEPEVIPADDVLELTCKDNIITEDTVVVPETVDNSKHDEVNGINNEKKERSYRKRRDTSSSEGSMDDSHFQRRRNSNNYGYGRGYSTSSRRTNSIERHRKSYSPPRGRYRSRSPNRYNNNRNRNRKLSYRNSRNRDTRYSRRSRSISRDRRRRFDSRERNNRAMSSNRKDRTLSRSSAGYRRSDNRSVRSVPTSSKRRRVSSQSPNCKRKQSTGGSTDRHSSKHRSISRAKDNNASGIQREETKKMEMPAVSLAASSEMNNGYRSKGTRRRKSTERSGRSHRSHSQSSTSSDSSCSSSSSSSSSSSGSSYDSEASSVFHSGQETMSQKGNRFANCVDSGLLPRQQHPQRKAEPIEERRVVFIGRLEPELTKEDLRRKFVKYGQVMEVTLHRKDDGTRYGFVTFSKAEQSYRVVERANLDPELGRYDVSFGGRRAFCRHLYADLDDLETLEDIDYYGVPVRRPPPVPRAESSFDSLLEQMRMAVEAKRARGQRESPRI